MDSQLPYLSNFPSFQEHGTPPCAETDPEAFFAQEDEFNGKLVSSSYVNEKAAKEICDSCPFRMECLTFAIMHREIGIWGGTTDGERRNIRRRLKIK